MPKLFIFSDLHLLDQDDPLLKSLTLFLEQNPKSGDHVVFAGDVFDLFVGDKKVFFKRFQSFFETLDHLKEAQVKVSFIEGNHDFQLEDTFKRYPEVHFYKEEFSEVIDGKRFYFAHGDLVNLEDYPYLLWRNFTRTRGMRAFVKHVPDFVVEFIGKHSGNYSRGQKPLLPEDFPKEDLTKLRKIYHEFATTKAKEGYDFIVLGHCHDLDSLEIKHAYKGQEKTSHYFNMGFPRVHGNGLVFEGGVLKRLPFFEGAGN